ncbi:MAG: hypothetical protein NZ918_04950 [Aigarchaeota archaeon]|nr:hypothetical protein [Aigarchaeota archaeon]
MLREDMRLPKSSITVLAALTVISCLLEAAAISNPIYLPEEYPEIAPGPIAAYGQKLVIYSPAKASVSILDPETGETRSFPAPRDVGDMEVSGRWLALAPLGLQKLVIYDLETGESRELELPGVVHALESADGLFWATIPDEEIVVAVDPSVPELVKRVEAASSYGSGSISVHGQRLWAIGRDLKTIVSMDLERGEVKTGGIDAEAVAIRGLEGGAVIATTQDEILKMSNALRVEARWKLEEASSLDIALYVIPDGRIVYVSPSRWVVGEIEGSEKREIKVGGRIMGSALSGDKIWFTESTTHRIGYVPLSRPPRIMDFKVERLGGNTFKASAKATDPDEDLGRVVLIILYEGIIGPEQNQSVEMENIGDGLYAATVNLEYQAAEIRAVAIDKFSNTAKSGTIRVEVQRMEIITETTTQTATTQAGGYTDIYTIGSSMLLLIPILIALLYFRLRPKKRRKSRK